MNERINLRHLYRDDLQAARTVHRNRTAQCPSLSRLADGRLTALDEEHVKHCAYCRGVLRHKVGTDRVLKPLTTWLKEFSGKWLYPLSTPALAALAVLFVGMLSSRGQLSEVRAQGIQIQKIENQLNQSTSANAALQRTLADIVADGRAEHAQIRSVVDKIYDRSQVLESTMNSTQAAESSTAEGLVRIATALDCQEANVFRVETQTRNLRVDLKSQLVAYRTSSESTAAALAAIRELVAKTEQRESQLNLFQAAYYDAKTQLEQSRTNNLACQTVMAELGSNGADRAASPSRPNASVNVHAVSPSSATGSVKSLSEKTFHDVTGISGLRAFILIPHTGNFASSASSSSEAPEQEWTGTLSINADSFPPLRLQTVEGASFYLNLSAITPEGSARSSPVKISGKVVGNSIQPESITILGPPTSPALTGR